MKDEEKRLLGLEEMRAQAKVESKIAESEGRLIH